MGQKIARDAFAEFGKKGRNDLKSLGWSSLETEACTRVAASVAQAVANGASKMRAWDGAWRDVYLLADGVCDRVMSETFSENKNLSAKL